MVVVDGVEEDRVSLLSSSLRAACSMRRSLSTSLWMVRMRSDSDSGMCGDTLDASAGGRTEDEKEVAVEEEA